MQPFTAALGEQLAQWPEQYRNGRFDSLKHYLQDWLQCYLGPEAFRPEVEVCQERDGSLTITLPTAATLRRADYRTFVFSPVYTLDEAR